MKPRQKKTSASALVFFDSCGSVFAEFEVVTGGITL
jgi:hypothetical protein